MFKFGGHTYLPQRIFGIGRNYGEHVKEMGNALPSGDIPLVFMKPITSLVYVGAPLKLPRSVGVVHHEMELVLILGQGGADIAVSAALRRVAGATLGLDLTLRDEQARLKQAGAPWELAKAFDGSAAVGSFTPTSGNLDVQALDMLCTVNGQVRQQGNTRDMLHPVASIISFLSSRWQLLPGDLIYTGTPAGVGPLKPGDRIEISSPALGSFAWDCT